MDFLEASNRILGGKKGTKASPYLLPSVAPVNPLIGTPGFAQQAEAPAPALANAAPAEKRGPVREFFHDVGQTARAVGTGLYSAAADVLPGTVAKALTGSDINLEDDTRRQRYIAKQAEDLKRWEMSPDDRENKLFGIVKAGTVQQGLQNLGYSAAPMIAGFGTGAAAASMVDTPMSLVADIVGGMIGAGALTAPMAYNASKADYVLQMRDAFKQARPNGTEAEWQQFKAAIEDNAKLYGLWEAGPEVVGNMVAAGLIKTPVGGLIEAIPLIESSAARLLASGVAKRALDMPVELATETITGYNQAKIEYESGLRAEPPTFKGAFIETAPQTIILTLATMGLGSVANSLMADNSGQVQRHKIIRLLNKSGVSKDTIGDLLDAKDWNGFDAAIKKHGAEIEKVGVDLAQAERDAGRPVDPNAPKVNPLMTPPAPTADQASVFDQPMTPAVDEAAAPVNPLLDTPKPTANAEDAKLVADAMASRGEKFAGIQAVDAPQSNPAVQAVAEASEKFGLRTIWVAGPRVDGMVVQGAVVGDKPVLLLNTELLTDPRRDPVMVVYAHELTHRSQKVDAKNYATLEGAVLARPEAQANVAQKIAAGMDEATARSEAVAEAVEVLGTDQAFWQEVFTGKEQSFIDHILQILQEMAERVFGTNQAAQAAGIRDAAVAAFQALQQQGVDSTTDSTLTTNVEAETLIAPAGPAAEAASAPVISSQERPPRKNFVEMDDEKLMDAYHDLRSRYSARPSESLDKRIELIGNELSYRAGFDDDRPWGARGFRPVVSGQPTSAPTVATPAPQQEATGQAARTGAKATESTTGEKPKVRKPRTRAQREAAKARRKWDFDRGDTPLLNLVIDVYGGINSKAAKGMDSSTYGVSREETPASIRDRLFPTNGRGSDWNDIVWQAVENGLLQEGDDQNTLAENLNAEIRSINRRYKQERELAREYRERDKDDKDFQRDLFKDAYAKNVVAAEDLKIGDAFERNGVRYEVIDVHRDGSVIIESDKYGERMLDADSVVNADGPVVIADTAGLEDVPFSMKPDKQTRAQIAESIEDDTERANYAKAELEKLAGIPSKANPKSIALVAQNRISTAAKRLLRELTSGLVEPAAAMAELDYIQSRAELAVARDERKVAKGAKAAAESRQQELPLTPFGTPEGEDQGVLFSAKKATEADVEEEARGKVAKPFYSQLRRVIEAKVPNRATVAQIRATIDPSKGSGVKNAPSSTEQDADYMAAVERGDTETAQRIVDEAAKRAGFIPVTLYHGTISKDEFTVFDAKKNKYGWFYFSQSKDVAARRGHYEENRLAERIVSAYINPGKVEFIDYWSTGDLNGYKGDADTVVGVQADSVPEHLMDLREIGTLTQEVLEDDWRYGIVEIAVKSPSQIKSADAITRDDAGRIIPPSERFNQERDDIRFSMKFDGDSSKREYGWNKFAWRQLGVMRNDTYGQKSTAEAVSEIESVMEKHGYQWMLDHLTDLSKEAKDEFPVRLRGLAGRMIHDTANRIFRQYGIADDGSNMPSDPKIEKLWLDIQNSEKLAKEQEVEFGRSAAFERSSYAAGNMTNPMSVRKTLNDIAEKMASKKISRDSGPDAVKEVLSVNAELKKAHDEAIEALRVEREKNAAKDDTIATLHNSLKKRNRMQISANEKARESNSEVSAKVNEYLDELAASIEAAGGSVADLSSKPTMDLLKMYVTYFVGKNGRSADTDSVRAFIEKHGFTGLDDVTVDVLINDANIAIVSKIRAPASKKKGAAAKPKKPLNLEGKPIVIVGEADAKRIALEATEAGQMVMRTISNNLEVIISNAIRHGRNRAGIAAKLVEAGVDTATANRIARDVVKARQDAMRPAIETLRQRYAKRGDKTGRALASAMDRIMTAMELADKASESKVSGFFDGNSWDEARNIIEAAFGFKSEITREWFEATMKLYREYEAADDAGNHIEATKVHRTLLNRVAKVQHGHGWWAAVRSYIQGGLLFGPATHAWNLINTASRNIDYAFIESERMVIRGVSEKNWDMIKAAFAPWYILGKSHKQAAGVAKYIMKTGVNPLAMRIGEESKFGSDPMVASAPEWHPFFQQAWMRPFKYVGRALIAADSYFRMNIENTDIYLRAYRDALKDGKSGAQAAKEALGLIGFISDGTNEAYNKAAAKADAFGLKGVDREMNICIDLMNAVDPDMRDHASKQGAVETFNDPDPEGLAGMMADTLRHTSWMPGSFWLGMFARIGANVFNYGLQTSPFGLPLLAWTSTVGTYKNKSRYVVRGDEFSKRALRGVHGLAIAGSVLAMCLKAGDEYDDDDDPKKVLKFGLTARGPRDINGQKLWRQQNKPFMLTINGKEYSYKWAGPFATPLALVGAIMDEKRYGNVRDAEDEDGREESVLSAVIPTMLYGIMTITTDELPGQGMVEFADLIYSSGQSSEQTQRAWSRFIQRQTASIGTAAIPYSALVRYLDRIADPTVYTAQNIDGAKIYAYSFLRNMPYIRSRALYPMRNIFGEPIQVPDKGENMGMGERAVKLAFDRFMNNMAKDEDIQFLMKAERGFRAPSRDETRIVITEDGRYGLRRMTDGEYDAFLEMFGRSLRDQVARVRKSYSTSEMVDRFVNKDNDVLKKRLSEARKAAMNVAMREFLTKRGESVRVKKK